MAAALAEVTLGEPLNGMVEIAGPDRVSLAELVQHYLKQIQDPRQVIVDSQAPYYGAVLNDQSLVPGENPRLGGINFQTWLNGQLKNV